MITNRIGGRRQQMKKKTVFKEILIITLSSLLSLVVYALSAVLLRAFYEDREPGSMFLYYMFFCITLDAAFSYILLFWTVIRRGDGEFRLADDVGSGAYSGFFRDWPRLFVSEKRRLIIFAIISGVSWSLVALDGLIPGPDFSAVCLVFFPVFVTAALFESVAPAIPKIVGYALGPVFCYSVYITVYALLRKKWRRQLRKR